VTTLTRTVRCSILPESGDDPAANPALALNSFAGKPSMQGRSVSDIHQMVVKCILNVTYQLILSQFWRSGEPIPKIVCLSSNR
jgi:hypothetical protein